MNEFATGSPFVSQVAMSHGPREAWLPRPFPQLLRGPNHTWWRPVVSFLVVGLGLFLVALTASLVVAFIWGRDADLTVLLDNPNSDAHSWDRVWLILITNLTLAALIPVAWAGVAGQGWRPRWAASVVGGVRWSWLARCLVVGAAVMVVGNAIVVLASGGADLAPERHGLALALVVLFTTPLQAAGEEYLFRGWMSQAIGSVIPSARVGGLIAALVSALAFAWAHGQQDPWLFADRLLFGLVASFLVWRTGGLEASIGLHSANNVVALGYALFTGQVEDMLGSTTGDWELFVTDAVIVLVAAAGIIWLARRYAVARLFRPPLT